MPWRTGSATPSGRPDRGERGHLGPRGRADGGQRGGRPRRLRRGRLRLRRPRTARRARHPRRPGPDRHPRPPRPGHLHGPLGGPAHLHAEGVHPPGPGDRPGHAADPLDDGVVERARALVRAAAALRGWLLAPTAEADEVYDPYGAPVTVLPLDRRRDQSGARPGGDGADGRARARRDGAPCAGGTGAAAPGASTGRTRHRGPTLERSAPPLQARSRHHAGHRTHR